MVEGLTAEAPLGKSDHCVLRSSAIATQFEKKTRENGTSTKKDITKL